LLRCFLKGERTRMFNVQVWGSRGCTTDAVPVGGKYGTELQTTCVSLEVNMEFVELLLKKGADLNAQGATFAIPRMYD
jgi:hypothetical protein